MVLALKVNAVLTKLMLKLFINLLSMPHLISMSATNILPVIHASMQALQMALNVDGALEEPSTTKELETPHSNAVDSRQDNHMLSLAQLSSELLTAAVSTAISLLINAANLNKVNSQLWMHATRLAQW